MLTQKILYKFAFENKWIKRKSRENHKSIYALKWAKWALKIQKLHVRKTELCVHSCVKPKNMHYDKKSKNVHATCVKKILLLINMRKCVRPNLKSKNHLWIMIIDMSETVGGKWRVEISNCRQGCSSISNNKVITTFLGSDESKHVCHVISYFKLNWSSGNKTGVFV